MFHFLSFILLLLITYTYYKEYKKQKSPTTRLLAYSFAIITLSQLFFMFINLFDELYVIAEIVQLVGYIGLLITFIKVLRYGRKKITD